MLIFAIQMNFTTVASLLNRFFDRLEGTEAIVNFICVEIYANFYWQTNCFVQNHRVVVFGVTFIEIVSYF